MSIWLIGIVTVCYGVTGIEQLIKGNVWFGVMWLCYGVANIALAKAGGV